MPAHPTGKNVCSLCFIMPLTIRKSYITDEGGKITNVILDYATYKKIEELLLDDGLLKAMKEAEDDDSVNYKITLTY